MQCLHCKEAIEDGETIIPVMTWVGGDDTASTKGYVHTRHFLAETGATKEVAKDG